MFVLRVETAVQVLPAEVFKSALASRLKAFLRAVFNSPSKDSTGIFHTDVCSPAQIDALSFSNACMCVLAELFKTFLSG